MKKEIFEQSVVEAIKGIKGCQFVGITYTSVPSMNNSQKAAVCLMSGDDEELPIIKVCKGQVQVNFSYENAVNNRGEKEQGEPINFVAAPLVWGHWVVGQVNKLIEHKGQLYLRFYGLKNADMESVYYIGGKLATAEQSEYIKRCTERGSVKSQESAGLTENQVIARCVKISNIMSITIGGVTYTRK